MACYSRQMISNNPILVALTSLTLLSVISCSNDSSSPSDNNLSLALPLQLTNRTNINLDHVLATVSLLNTDIKSTLFVSSESASGKFPNVPFGDYTLYLAFVLEDPETNFSIPLAHAEKNITVSSATTVAKFIEGDFIYGDNDNDNYSNLAEIESDTDLNDANDYPDTALIFITQASGPGNLSEWAFADGLNGVAAGDRICSNSAQAAGLIGEFKAWISDNDNDAVCRFNGLSGQLYKNGCNSQQTIESKLGPWLQTNGTLFSKNLARLLEDDVIYYPLQSDEHGNQHNEYVYTWTGTLVDGQGKSNDAPNGHCNNWTSSSENVSAIVGGSDVTIGQWTSNHNEFCSEFSHLICMQTDTTAPLPSDHSSGKKAFITHATGNADLSSWDLSGGKSGLEAADMICQSSAENAALSNSNKYIAWLSSESDDAIDRLQSEGPWVRLDGIKFVENKRQLLDLPFTSLNLDETGQYQWDYVLTGTQSSTGRVLAGQTCQNWTSSNDDEQTFFGSSTAANNHWWTESSDGYQQSCQAKFRLYCFEQD